MPTNGRMEQIVIGAHQSFVMEYPRALAKLVLGYAHLSRHLTSFCSRSTRFINHMKYISGDKTAIGQQGTGFGDLSTHQLVDRATTGHSGPATPYGCCPGNGNGNVHGKTAQDAPGRIISGQSGQTDTPSPSP